MLRGKSIRWKTSEPKLEQRVQHEEHEKEKEQRNLDVKRLMVAKLNEVPHLDQATDERTDVDYVAQWKLRIHEFETMDRETLPDIVNGAISAERSPAEIRTHPLMNTQAPMQHATVRAAIETFLAVGWKWDRSRAIADGH